MFVLLRGLLVLTEVLDEIRFVMDHVVLFPYYLLDLGEGHALLGLGLFIVMVLQNDLFGSLEVLLPLVLPVLAEVELEVVHELCLFLLLVLFGEPRQVHLLSVDHLEG